MNKPELDYIKRTGLIYRIAEKKCRPATSHLDHTDLSKSIRVSAIIPTLNEAENLPHVLPKIPDCVDEVILVDGHSTDETINVAQQLRPDIKIVVQPKRGKGEALRCGFGAATGDIIVMLDADGSTDPGEIPAFIDMILAGADFAKGSRFLPGGGSTDISFLRRIGNFGFVTLVRVLFGGRFSDLNYGYIAFWKDALPFMNLYGDGFEIESIMNIRALRIGLNVSEVPSFEYPRIHGTSRLRVIPDGMRVLRAILSESWQELHNEPCFDEAILELPVSDGTQTILSDSQY